MFRPLHGYQWNRYSRCRIGSKRVTCAALSEPQTRDRVLIIGWIVLDGGTPTRVAGLRATLLCAVTEPNAITLFSSHGRVCG